MERRGENEHEALRARIDAALRDDEARLEVEMARKTLADVHWDQATQAATLAATLAERKRTLLTQLRARWSPLPPEVEQTVEATQDADRLAEWLVRFATAVDLDGVGIRPRR